MNNAWQEMGGNLRDHFQGYVINWTAGQYPSHFLFFSGPQLCPWDPVCQRGRVLVTTMCREHWPCGFLLHLSPRPWWNLTANGTVSGIKLYCDDLSQLTLPPGGLRRYCGAVKELALSFWTDGCFLTQVFDTSALYVVVHTWRNTFVAQYISN